MSENWRQSDICIVINYRSQDSPAKHVCCGGLIHCNFITEVAGKTFSKTGEHLAELQAKRLIVSYAPFALDFCPQRCRTRQISKITCILRTETVTHCCYVNRHINMRLLSTNIKLLQTSFDLLTDRLMPSVTDRLLIMYGILLQWFFSLWQQLCTVGNGIFYMAGVNIFLLLN